MKFILLTIFDTKVFLLLNFKRINIYIDHVFVPFKLLFKLLF